MQNCGFLFVIAIFKVLLFKNLSGWKVKIFRVKKWEFLRLDNLIKWLVNEKAPQRIILKGFFYGALNCLFFQFSNDATD